MKKSLLFLLLITGLLSSCIQENFDNPGLQDQDPNLTTNITIADLKAMYSGVAFEITDTLIMTGIVVGDDKTGNLYKTLVIQDNTGGIAIRMDNNGLFGAYPVGRRVFIKLQGLWLGEYSGLIQLGGGPSATAPDEVDLIPSGLFDQYVIKGSLNNPVVPIDVDIMNLDNSYQNMLIRLTGVQFSVLDTSKTYANATLQLSENRTLQDCSGNTILVRTSGYADFANIPLPNGNGEFVCIYSVFGTTAQLIIRHPDDAKMNGVRCDPFLSKNFEDGSLTSGGWTVQQPVGPSVNWSLNTAGAQNGTYYAQCRNYLPPNVACETWLISPALDFSAATNPILTFMTACNYTGANLQILISENYNSGLPATATWTIIPATISAGSWSWVGSGDISILSLLGGPGDNVHIAFKYTGSASDGKTWELDDILIEEQ